MSEQSIADLAEDLHFRLERHGSGLYTLRRVVDVSSPVEEQNLTLDQAAAFLNDWKLRGFHGG